MISLALLLVACGSRPPSTAVADSPAAPAPAPSAPPAPASGGPPPPITSSARLEIPTAGAPIVVTPVRHATMLVQRGELTIWVDPWSEGRLEGRPPPDVVLISDIHRDHLDAQALRTIGAQDAVVVAPAAVADALAGDPLASVVRVLANGERAALDGVEVQAVAMYNLRRGPESGGVFHERGRGNGYVLEIGGKRLYIAGDTECTDEMRALQDIDVAFVPMNLPYTMPPDEAAACVRAFQPALAVPYHYRGSDIRAFADALADLPQVDVRLLDFYPGGL